MSRSRRQRRGLDFRWSTSAIPLVSYGRARSSNSLHNRSGDRDSVPVRTGVNRSPLAIDASVSRRMARRGPSRGGGHGRTD